MGIFSFLFGDPPPAPDYKGAAEATGQSSLEAQTRADWANRPTQITPWGTQSWQAKAGVDPATGQPITNWTQQLQLAGPQQQALEAQMGIQAGKSDIAQGMLGRLNTAYQQPFSMGGVQGFGQVSDPSQLRATTQVGQVGDLGRQRIENALFERMRPEQERSQAALETQLANQGLTRGSDAWNTEMQRLGDQQARERFNALEMGGREQERQFGMGLKEQQQAFGQQAIAGSQNFQQDLQLGNYENMLRQQQIGEQQLLRSIPLNELNALLTGSQVAQPSMPSFNTSKAAGQVDYLGAAGQGYNAQLDAYNAQQGAAGNFTGGLFDLGSAGITKYSDARLKRDIRVLFTLPNGIEVCSYRMMGKDGYELGVVAQQVREIMPSAVVEDKEGMLRVNYDLVLS